MRKRLYGTLVRRRLQSVLALALFLCPIGAATPLTFRRALELAARYRPVGTSTFADQPYETCAQPQNLYLRRQAIGSSNLVAPQSGAPSILNPSRSSSLSTAPDRFVAPTELRSPRMVTIRDQSQNAILTAAIAYANLITVNLQVQVVHRQQLAAERLRNVEAQRVLAGVDNPAALTRAKLIAAHVELRSAGLECSMRELRKQLADLTGLSEDEAKPLAESMPLFANAASDDAELQLVIKQLSDVRDIAQLEFILARANRNETETNVELATANLADQIVACILEDEKLNALLAADFELQKAELQVLEARGQLEEWASASPVFHSTKASNQREIIVTPISRDSDSETLTSPAIRSIMITPAVSSLGIGQSRQFSAIVIYDDGSAKDSTSEAKWLCDSNRNAIVSRSGLLTALASGRVTISATVFGISQSRQIMIGDGD